MKTLKTLLSAFAIVAVFATGALAQGTGTITASANVVADVTVDGVQNLNFGAILDTDADDGVTVSLTDAATDSLGKFDISGVTASSDLVLSISGPSVLTQSGPSGLASADDLPFSVTAKYTEAEGDLDGTGANQEEFTSGTAEPTSVTATSYVYVGGTVGGSAGTYNGTYSGDVTLSVYYN